MNSKVFLRNKKTGTVQEFTFELAQNILRLDKNSDFECADNKHQFIKNELIKRASDSGSKETTKSKRAKKGGKVPK